MVRMAGEDGVITNENTDDELAKVALNLLTETAPKDTSVIDVVNAFKNNGFMGGMGKVIQYFNTPEGQQIIGGLVANSKPYAGKYLVDKAQERMEENYKMNAPILPKQKLEGIIDVLKQKQILASRGINNSNGISDNFSPPDVPEGYEAKRRGCSREMDYRKIGLLHGVANPEYLDIRKRQFNEGMWSKLGKAVNQLSASSRSVLGIAGSSNMRADRSLKLLKPDMTPEDKDLVVTDLQAIMKGGTPDEIQIRRGLYNSLPERAIKLIEYVTANPHELNVPEIQEKLIQTVNDLKDVDNKVIEDNLGINYATFKGTIENDPGRWEELTKAVRSATSLNPKNIKYDKVNDPLGLGI